MRKKARRLVLRPRHIFVCLLISLLLFSGVILSQRTKLGEILVQEAQLQEEYERLQLEEERLTHMLEYAQTDEYLEQYAREKFGYLGPEDYKFYTDPQ